MIRKLRYKIAVISLVTLMTGFGAHVADGNQLCDTKYTDEFVKEWSRVKNLPEKEWVKMWSRYEAKHSEFNNVVFWNTVGFADRTAKNKLIKEKALRLPEIVNRLPEMARFCTETVTSIINQLRSQFGFAPEAHIYLCISPTWVDAKAQRFKNDSSAIEFNLAHSTFSSDKMFRVILAHELFHNFQEQSLKMASEIIDYDSITGKLMAEGMATYYSSIAIPSVSKAEALLMSQSDIDSLSKQRPVIARDVLNSIYSKDKETIDKYFHGAWKDGPYRPRSGYYIGHEIASELVATYGLHKTFYLSPSEYLSMATNILEEMQQNREGNY